MRCILFLMCFMTFNNSAFAQDENIEMNKEIVKEYTQCAGLLFTCSSKEKAINGKNEQSVMLEKKGDDGLFVASLYLEGTGETTASIASTALYISKNARDLISDSSKQYAFEALKDQCLDEITNSTKHIAEKRWTFGLSN